MQKVLTAEEMREVDRLTTEKYGIPSLILMENAAHAAARVITEKLGGSVAGKRFLILCGKGNNGGDGAALARILWTEGADVWVELFGKFEETKGDARINFAIIKKINDSEYTNAPNDNCLFFEEAIEAKDSIIDFDKDDAVIDALFGTGLTRPIESNLASDVIKRLVWLRKRRTKPLFISLDLPSGLSSDSAESIGANFESDLTVTFTAPKPANVLPPASRFNGELIVANIGSPQELIDDSPSQLFVAEKSDVQSWLRATKISDDSHKTARGRAMIVAGSRNMTGAAVLAGNAAMRSGVGLLRIVTSLSAQQSVSAHTFPEAMVAGVAETENGAISEAAWEKVQELSKKIHAAAIGCGLSSDEETTKKFVRRFVENRKTSVVIDADGLNSLAPFDIRGSDELPLILTPHIGEMRKLLGVDDDFDFSDRVKIVRDFAQKHHVILVLKGERNLIAEPGGKVVVNPTGNAGLGKAGNGDTLAGIITAFLAQSYAAEWKNTFETVVAAVYTAGLAGDTAARKIGMRTMAASDVCECLGEAFASLKG